MRKIILATLGSALLCASADVTQRSHFVGEVARAAIDAKTRNEVIDASIYPPDRMIVSGGKVISRARNKIKQLRSAVIRTRFINLSGWDQVGFSRKRRFFTRENYGNAGKRFLSLFRCDKCISCGYQISWMPHRNDFRGRADLVSSSFPPVEKLGLPVKAVAVVANRPSALRIKVEIDQGPLLQSADLVRLRGVAKPGVSLKNGIQNPPYPKNAQDKREDAHKEGTIVPFSNILLRLQVILGLGVALIGGYLFYDTCKPARNAMLRQREQAGLVGYLALACIVCGSALALMRMFVLIS